MLDRRGWAGWASGHPEDGQDGQMAMGASSFRITRSMTTRRVSHTPFPISFRDKFMYWACSNLDVDRDRLCFSRPGRSPIAIAITNNPPAQIPSRRGN